MLGGGREVDDQREVIGADHVTEPSTLHREVVGEKKMVDRDPIGHVGRPASLPTKPDPAIAESGNPQKVAKVGGAVRAVHVPHDNPRASGFRRDFRNRVDLGISRLQAPSVQR